MLLRPYSSVVTPLAPTARCCSFNTIATLVTRSISSPSLTSAATATATRLRLYTSAAATRTRSRPSPASSIQQLYPDRVYASPAPEATTPSASTSASEVVNMVKPIQGTQYALDAQFKKISRDFRTDTITMPTDEMFDLMRHASRGDDVYGEDQATNDLQDKIAKMAGKEAGLFCVSGTMTNQLAIRTHLTQPPHSIILDARSHVHLYEAGGVAMHSQASSHAVPPKNGHHLTLEEVLDNCVFGEDIHSAPTKLVSLENTLSGMVFPQEEIIRISDCMRENGIIMHCDGARMWEVAAKTGMSLEELCRPFDTVSLCLSKGLGAPVGSVLVGPRKFIEKVKWFRKAFGGGIRQCGSLSVSANYCVDNHFPKLKATHELTSYLAKALAELGAQLLLPVETNMLWLDPSSLGFPITTLAERAKTRGLTLGSNRVVVHHQITREAVDDLIQLVRDMKDEFKDQPKREIDQEQNLLYAQGVYQRPIEPPIARLGTSYGKNQ